jgi:hypothetical protein
MRPKGTWEFLIHDKATICHQAVPGGGGPRASRFTHAAAKREDCEGAPSLNTFLWKP